MAKNLIVQIKESEATSSLLTYGRIYGVCAISDWDLSNGIKLLLIEIVSFLIVFEIPLCFEVTLHYKNFTLIAINVRAEINFQIY